MGRLFGTDGVRGIANRELTAELAMQIGKAAAYVLTEETCYRLNLHFHSATIQVCMTF